MKFVTIFLALTGLALAAPQPQEESSSAVSSILTSSFSVSSTVVISDASTTVSLTPQQTCLNACPIGDVNCQARCVGAARPNEAQANQTTECVAQCDQGDGSPAATDRYGQCVQSCIASHFPSTQTAGAIVGGATTAASNAASVTSGAAATASSGAASATSRGSGVASSVSGAVSSATESAAAAATGGAASNVQMGASAAGIAGLFMAVFAL